MAFPKASGPAEDGAALSRPVNVLDWVAIHSLGWLLIANLVGLWMATLLVFPRLGEALAPLTYGRWVPLHLDLQLYGWCSLPLVGLLLEFFGCRGRAARLAITAWSASLVFGALWWLDGGSSGKLFLEWGGPSRLLLASVLALLALVLLIAFVRQVTSGQAGAGFVPAGKAVFLAVLVGVPFVLYWAASPEVYPSFNPDSGGSTGGSLLGSTLGLIAIFCLTPLLLGLKRIGDMRVVFRTLVVLALHSCWFLFLDHGNRSHHEVLEIVSLASLLVWVPMLTRYLKAFEWPRPTRLWLGALAFWGVLLVLTGVVGFLPGILERWKFTSALVGHAHIAMAGLVTSFNMLVLLSLGDGLSDPESSSNWSSALVATGPFKLWHFGLGAQVVALFTIGTLEGFDPGFSMRWPPLAAVLFSIRGVAGAAMVVASAQWLMGALAAMSSPAMSSAEQAETC